MQIPTRVLMVDPEYFDVVYVINPHMKDQVGKVDHKKARVQWKALRTVYEKLGFPVEVLPGVPGLPDMVFAANQSFPFVTSEGKKKVILSRMASKERAAEVPFFERWYHTQDYEIILTGGDAAVEGMGDLLWHPGKCQCWGGYGFRTDRSVYKEIARITEIPVLELELKDPEFYHLDTCLAPVSEACAVYYPNAFTVESRRLLEKHFSDLIEADETEARQRFVCNGHSPDGKHFIVQSGSKKVCGELKKRGIVPVEVDTSEFLKSGGSVFCMKMMIW